MYVVSLVATWVGTGPASNRLNDCVPVAVVAPGGETPAPKRTARLKALADAPDEYVTSARASAAALASAKHVNAAIRAPAPDDLILNCIVIPPITNRHPDATLAARPSPFGG
ncbi:MAG: hypothetical protein EPN98_20100 [Phenylobacterium sp.]|nr:MAG: hypothetical protein EPN98_20100 [Phenylobacterium sp.]